MAETDNRTAQEKAAALAAAKAAEAERVALAKAEIAASGRDPDERVWIKHPDIEVAGGPVPRHTISTTWAGKGWSETDAPEG